MKVSNPEYPITLKKTLVRNLDFKELHSCYQNDRCMSLEENVNNGNILPSFNATMFDDAAFEVFFKKHFKALCAYCQYKFSFDLDLAKDIVHTGFIKLWESRQTISPELSIKAYLYKIITNISLDIIKRDKIKHRHVKHIWQNTPENTMADDYHSVDFKQLEDLIEKAIEELPEQMRRVFELSRNEELKYAEIADQLGISIKTVETQMSRALQKLRKKLSFYIACYIIPLCCLFTSYGL
jgi:RNA polymerase sigma-70 factor, ECF subfamily